MLLKILVGLAAAYALFHTYKYKKTLPAVISLGMVAGIIMLLFTSPSLYAPGLFIYMAFALLAFIYGLTAKNKLIVDRVIISTLAASIFVYWLWVFNHWHGNELLLAILALLAGIAGLIRMKQLKNEWGFLAILAVDAIALVIEQWMKA